MAASNWIRSSCSTRSNSKLFSDSKSRCSSFEGPNANVSLFDCAFPGTLPEINSVCVEQALKTSICLSANVNRASTFDRKHYFYHDLPAGYQITQEFEPFATGGFIVLLDENMKPAKSITISKLQLEQDSGKTVDKTGDVSLVDLNRSGAAVMEIVTEPVLRSAEEVELFLKKLQKTLEYNGICDSEQDESAVRCDVNISVVNSTHQESNRVELKHLSKNLIDKTCYRF
ncbi:Aspartyl/Glutamyl-tRNA amidotransferase, subunit B/E [Chytridium lagenaria]|nr:Aspartyl/Glutamyl-tRNA amidotransferase, subunit B/E [Chytridium lagenaria]